MLIRGTLLATVASQINNSAPGVRNKITKHAMREIGGLPVLKNKIVDLDQFRIVIASDGAVTFERLKP